MIYEINVKVDMHSNSSSYNINIIINSYASNYGDIIDSYNRSVIKICV